VPAGPVKSKPARGARRRGTARVVSALLATLALLWAEAATPTSAGSSPSSGQTVTLTVLATTDVHGNVWPYDYLRAQPAEGGLAKVSSYVKSVRARQSHTLVVDCGDTFQGTPLAYLYAAQSLAANPVVAAMNAIGYDAMAVGNHEFNFGLHTLWRLKEQARFPLLGANIVSTYHDHVRDFEPYVIREVGGVRVAFLGLVTPTIPYREPPENRAGYEFRGLVETARRYVPELRRKADLVILAVHAGLGRNPDTGEPLAGAGPSEDSVWDIAEAVPGIDAIVFGHSHQELAGKEVNGVLLVQAKNWARSVAEIDFVLKREGERWRVTERHSRLVPMDASIAADEEILDLTRDAHERTERYLGTVVGELDQTLDARTYRIEDHPLEDFIHRVQLDAVQAEVSLARVFSSGTRLAAGPVTIRDLYGLYFYENRLFAVELTGAQLKEALEYAASSFTGYPWPEGSAPFRGSGYDSAAGVSYQVDLTRPPGDRIRNLSFQGAPLAADRKLRVALNSYRWSGGDAYPEASGVRHARIVQRAEKEVRDLLIDWLRQHKQFPSTADHNWEIVPEEAREALRESVEKPPPQARLLFPLVLVPPRWEGTTSVVPLRGQ
jgi:2',3'-cyclic-nucleotide 2'-phosphodiesterase/3'-nucleotidase